MQWFRDMFTMIQDLRAEAPRVAMAIGLVLDVRNLASYWGGEGRVFECRRAPQAGG